MSHKEENVQAGPQIKPEYMKGQLTPGALGSVHRHRTTGPVIQSVCSKVNSWILYHKCGRLGCGAEEFLFLCKKMEILKFLSSRITGNLHCFRKANLAVREERLLEK